MADLVLATEHVELVLLPDKGCDIYAWTDRASGVDVLFKTPWGRQPPSAWPGDSMTAWHGRYPGGWQVLCPNGGAESEAPGGTRWGFHGEASLVPWTIEDADATRATLSTTLHRAPLSLRRTVELSGRTMTLEESVSNDSPEPIELMWVHHPAFGAPFLEAGCLVRTSARTVIVDDEQPGTMLEPASRHRWPIVSTKDGETLDLSAIPDPVSPRMHLAYLTDFEDGAYTIVNPRRGLAVELRWPLEVFPHAWFWQEVHSTAGYPWWRRAYVCAIEPASTIPGQGVAAAASKGGSLLRLAGGQTRSVVIEATLSPTQGA